MARKSEGSTPAYAVGSGVPAAVPEKLEGHTRSQVGGGPGFNRSSGSRTRSQKNAKVKSSQRGQGQKRKGGERPNYVIGDALPIAVCQEMQDMTRSKMSEGNAARDNRGNK